MPDLIIPAELVHPPFYENDLLPASNQAKGHAFFHVPFLAEILHKNNVLQDAPWDDKLQWVPALFEHWNSDEALLKKCYENRNRREARPLMVINLARLLSVIFWMNGEKVATAESVLLTEKLNELKKAPVNGGERLIYILQSPDHYHSYVQLRELFSEARKQFAIIKMKETR